MIRNTCALVAAMCVVAGPLTPLTLAGADAAPQSPPQLPQPQPMITCTALLRVLPRQTIPADDGAGRAVSGAAPISEESFDDYVTTLAHLVASRDVVHAAMASPKWALIANLNPKRVIDDAVRHLSVEHPPHTELIYVRFSDPDPRVAQQAVGLIVDTFLASYGDEDETSIGGLIQQFEARQANLRAAIQQDVKSLDDAAPAGLDFLDAEVKRRLANVAAIEARLTNLQIEQAASGDAKANAAAQQRLTEMRDAALREAQTQAAVLAGLRHIESDRRRLKSQLDAVTRRIDTLQMQSTLARRIVVLNRGDLSD